MLDPLHVLANLIRGEFTNPDFLKITHGDWQLVTSLSIEHGVAPLIYRKLSAFGDPQSIPEQVQLFFQEKYYESAAKNVLLLDELGKVLSCLKNAGIQVILLKGVSLVRKIYPDVALRPMMDIDLLVHPGEITKVARIIKKAGYEEQKSTYHVVFWGGPQNSTVLEIHWNLMSSNLNSATVESDWIWKDAQLIQDAYSLRIEKELLYLAGHLMIQHQNTSPRLIWLYDLNTFLEKYYPILDWNFIIDNSLTLGWNQALVSALQKTFEYFPSEKIEIALKSFPENFGQQSFSTLKTGWMQRAMRGMNVRRGIRTMKGVFFPGFSYMQWRYHLSSRKYVMMYYPRRWFELVKDLLWKK